MFYNVISTFHQNVTMSPGSPGSHLTTLLPSSHDLAKIGVAVTFICEF